MGFEQQLTMTRISRWFAVNSLASTLLLSQTDHSILTCFNQCSG